MEKSDLAEFYHQNSHQEIRWFLERINLHIYCIQYFALPHLMKDQTLTLSLYKVSNWPKNLII